MAPTRGATTLATVTTFVLAAVLAACAGETAAPIEATAPSSTSGTSGTGATGATAASGAATPPGAKSGTSASAPAKTTGRPALFDDPCNVLTLPEVQAAQPGAQAGQNPGSGANNGSCRWPGSSPLEPQIRFGFEWVEGAAAPLKASMEATLKASGARRLDVGDGASIRADDRIIEIRFIKGEFNASLSALPRGQVTEEAMIALAKQAAGRLSR